MKTKLMKRYEDETDEMPMWTWHNREFVTDDVLDWAHEKIQALEAQLTWRDAVKEPPKENGYYFVIHAFMGHRLVVKAEYEDGVWFYDDDSDNDITKDVVKYLPIPKE